MLPWCSHVSYVKEDAVCIRELFQLSAHKLFSLVDNDQHGRTKILDVNMRGSLWKCSQLQCKLVTTEESRGLEIQNQLLDDMKAEFQQFPGRRVHRDVEREGIPPSDADRPPAAPRVVQEEEDRTSALIPTLPPVTSPPPSLPELDSESHRSFREELQGENVVVPSDISSHLDSDRSHRTTCQSSRSQSWSRCLVT